VEFLSDPTTDVQPVPVEQESTSQAADADTRLSYKFQRLREKLREAITSGEFAGKLPGERQLAKRFHVNAKTLSKALTDLAAEGLLDRSIGRGTYVKGTAPAPAAMGRWLVLTDPASAESELVNCLRQANPDLAVCTDPSLIRPSYLNPFSAVLDLSGAPDAVIRDLVVRTTPVIAVGHEPRTFAMHCVMPDKALAGMKLGRDLLLAGHRRLVAVEPAGSTALAQSLRQAAQRYAPDATIDSCTPGEVATLLGDGAVGFVCDSVHSARIARHVITANAATEVALAAIGCRGDESAPCSGYYTDCQTLVDAVRNLLADPPSRPTAIWLACSWLDCGTIPTPESSVEPMMASRPMYATLAS